ncbi:hypothetical protein BO94DRAFT_614879 [Aspergillus sclerotioniger CBS 115572]|uniref:Cucumopine synthase C-terminal helical bundle domain-containing protein n=1 Tax=Aspergillus sclerotioniger CBS 115572 TaxID=1450535 RepID=A0A317X7F3_9EURO|nr:hypothetical protein BO94DRAFT_614879 [Aspergillus sclerotioniger CBS 115572]PWY93562.1 hypothetical protein BO94DRAFT_614879 [Aspergillus sclerotioniger CBS 115572]
MNISGQPLRELKIKWPKPNVTVTVRMNNSNPALVDILWDTLPYRSLQTHALVTGDHLYHLVPAERLIYTNPQYKAPDRAKEPDGTVFLSKFQHLAIKYGKVTEHHPAASVGTVIPEDLEKLRRAGKESWKSQLQHKEPIEVIVWDALRPEPGREDLTLRLQRTGVTKEVKNVVREIYNEMDKSWSGISNDIDMIHSGRARDNPGSKDSYFAAMIFSNSEVRTIGYYVLDNILKIAATHPEFSLRHLIVLYKEFVAVPTEFLGYVGTEFLRDSHRKIEDLIKSKVETNSNQEEAREDLLAMVSVLAQFVNLLNAQNLLLFPWKHTEEYPIPAESK